ncbi:MAG TPA: FecR family protein [Burkholderiales bacterium]|nr:FecR family protein [Burkholderiales bacterium]
MRVLLLGFACLCAAAAHAAANIEGIGGDVRAGAAAPLAPVRLGQRIDVGSIVTTGPKSRATLRFPDGQAVALHENSEFRITEYAYNREQPAGDRSRLELLKGTMRMVTGAIGRRNPQIVSVRTPMATMGVRGTDFMLAIVNPLFFQVLNGQISVVNSAGQTVFASGAIGTVAADGTAALTIPASQLPPGIVNAFNQLTKLQLAGLAPAEPVAKPGGALPGLPALAVQGAVLIGIAAAIAGDEADLTTPGTTGTTGTTGTGTTGTSGTTGTR